MTLDNLNQEDSLSPCPLCWILMQELGKSKQITENTISDQNYHDCLDENNSLSKTNIINNSIHKTKSSIVNKNSKSIHISEILLDELKRFCENTTIRGLPRIVKARSRILRVLWSSLVCILILGCFACMFFLAKQYLEYNVIHPPRVLRHTSSPFPSVTVCNFRPISPDGFRYLKEKGWKTPREFVLDLADYTRFIYFYKQRMEEYNAASAAFSLAGFLESLPNNKERQRLGYQHDKLIIKCQITYLNGSKPVAAPCDRRGVWRKFVHAQYLNCATFEPFSYLRSNTTSIEMYIYLDEMFGRAKCPDCFHGEVKSQLSGALIAIHGADILPNINDKSINLKPGSLTEIRLSIVENIQQMPPYGRCSINHPTNLKLHDMYYNYSEYACRQATIQADINEKCGCFSLEYPYNENDGYEPCTNLVNFINLSNCNTNELDNHLNKINNLNNNTNSYTNLTDNISKCLYELNKFTERMMCKRSVTENYVHGALPSCTMPCSFYSYETEQSTSSWPTKSWQLTWLNSSHNRKLGVFKGYEFEPYHRALKWLEKGNETIAAEILEQTRVLERKLLAVLINRPNFDVRKVEEKEVLSLTSLLSQTGGLFSIWIGLSMISLGEICEMFIRFFIRTRKRKKQTKLHNDVNTNQHNHNCMCLLYNNSNSDTYQQFIHDTITSYMKNYIEKNCNLTEQINATQTNETHSMLDNVTNYHSNES